MPSEILATPPKVADEMVDKLFAQRDPSPDSRLLVPGCGTGNLIKAVQRYCEKNGVTFPSSVAIEIDESVLIEAKEAVDDVDVEFQKRDFLMDVSDLGTFNYVIANPPYVGWESIAEEKREAYAYRFETLRTDASRSSTDMYMLFFEQALNLLADEGRLVIVTPDGFIEPKTAPSPLAELLHDYDVDVESVPAMLSELEVSTVISVVTQQDGPSHKRGRATLDWASELEKILQTHQVHARDIMTEEVVTYRPSDQVSRVALDMIRRDFDAIPVVEEGSEVCVGYVTKQDVSRASKGVVREYMKEDVDARFASPNAELESLLERLASSRFLLVGDGSSVSGIVTRFDLNRPPTYFHLYSKIAQFEVGLRKALREKGVSYEEHLDKPYPIKSRYRKYRDVAPDALACAQLSDLINVAESCGLHGELAAGISVPEEADVWDLNELRKHVAHYYPVVHTMDNFSESDSQRTVYQLYVEYELLDQYVARLRREQ